MFFPNAAPSIVGKAFVKQYYTQMHKDPTQLHRFYLEHSSFVHGGADIGSEDPVMGQKVSYCRDLWHQKKILMGEGYLWRFGALAP